ncbi:MAG TPA: ATP-binding cassette domain-containing protein [Caldithrix abyssi]|uniref:ATP-binding cassette domain-containing protein n=1 Tax=Caldithrix abyssi TaxID=187145 RepID=A0A7V4U015_CALAY|nr:ATP-binding cassette domain-containing protein [Caldithrix abyssi]
MLQIRDLNYSIGERNLLKEIRWIINPGERVGLIGPNGAGKTTLLRIIAGELQADRQAILKPAGYRIGYLPQEELPAEQASVLVTVLRGNRELVELEEEMERIHTLLQNGSNDEALLQRLGTLESRYSALGGYAMEAGAKQILAGLGFGNDDYHKPLSALSGGWRMRVHLARLLLQQPDLLLLDEPTNHLDLDSLEWVEQYLKRFRGSMILVSHDRFFLDRLSTKIAELSNGKLSLYSGNYRTYEKEKKAAQERLLKQWEEQKAERERIQRFVDRFRYKATKAAQVQSRIKKLEKMQMIEPPETSGAAIHFVLKPDVQSYKEVLSLHRIHFRYQSDWVLKDISFHLYRGQKVALVGKNGAGKTTLTKLIFGQITAQQGQIDIGERVHMGYYAQHQIEALNLDNTIIDEVASAAAPGHLPRLRDILGVFRFSGDDVHKKVGVLSGGEKARVSLAKMLLSPANFLIMDEPTNHLDLFSKEALEKALAEYEGTLLLISHDRYFLDKMVDRVFELKNGQLHEYAGNYSDYLSRKESVEPAFSSQKPKEHKAVNGRLKKSKEQKQREAQARQSVSKERRRLQKEIEQAESLLDEKTARKTELERQLADPITYQDHDKSVAIQKEYDLLLKEIETLENQWENAQLELETILEKITADV